MSKRILSSEELASVAGMPSRMAAKQLGVGKSTINDARAAFRAKAVVTDDLPVAFSRPLKILLLDLETAPNLAYVWGAWDQNVGLNQFVSFTEVICWGARWLDGDEVMVSSIFVDGKEEMLRKIHALYDEADAIMGWNSKGFDVKHLNREFVLAGMLPPSPIKHLDLMLDTKANFRFTSNKLDHIADQLLGERKVQHRGFSLWVDCMAGDKAAWEEMYEYQIQDVDLLEGIYWKLLPWIKNHPNAALYQGVENGCKNCGSTKLREHGVASTGISLFPQYQCNDCGTWQRGSKALSKVVGRKIV